MTSHLFEARYYETYYFANIVRNVLNDQFSYLRKLDEFYGDSNHLSFTRPFPRYSALHSFICFIIDYVIWEESDGVEIEERQRIQRDFAAMPCALEDLQPTLLPINLALDYYQIDHATFPDWLSEHGKCFSEAGPEDISEYYSEMRLEKSYEKLLDRAVSEVFFVLFQNRRLLLVSTA